MKTNIFLVRKQTSEHVSKQESKQTNKQDNCFNFYQYKVFTISSFDWNSLCKDN